MSTSRVKSALFAALFFVSAVVSVHAQDAAAPVVEGTTEQKPWWSVGPFFIIGPEILAGEIAEGQKTDMTMAFTGGAWGAINFNEKVAFALGVGYQKSSIYLRDERSPDYGDSTLNIGYLTFQPGLKFSSFLIGVNVGIPMSSTMETKMTIPASISTSREYSSDSLKTNIDVRLGAMIPIMQNEKSDLNFFVQGSYSLTGAHKERTHITLDGTRQSIKYNIASLQLGFCYTFDLGKH